MKKVLLQQHTGSGLEFQFITALEFKSEEAVKHTVKTWDGMSIGMATFYLADIVGVEQQDRDEMILSIPYVKNCPSLSWNKEKHVFDGVYR